jgi:hypothetical protein
MQNQQIRRAILLNILERNDPNAVQAFVAEQRRRAFAAAAQKSRKPFLERHPALLFALSILANAIVLVGVLAILFVLSK